MGQETLLDETLAAIRRKKKLYIKRLGEVHTIEDRNRLKEKINILSDDESKILEQLKYDEVF